MFLSMRFHPFTYIKYKYSSDIGESRSVFKNRKMVIHRGGRTAAVICLWGLLSNDVVLCYGREAQMQAAVADTEDREQVRSGGSDAAGGSQSGAPAQEPDAPAEASQIALTFDDGPHPVYTEQILDGLKERGVTATFFVLGENIAGNEAILERMYQEGHLIGNHTYSHLKLDCMDQSCAVEEIRKTSQLVEQVTGEGTEYVRPPFGIWSRELEYDVTMLPVLWTIDTLDWTTKNVPATVNKVLKQAKDQDILLFHDCYASSAEAALRVVDELQARGYEFVTVDRIILAP